MSRVRVISAAVMAGTACGVLPAAAETIVVTPTAPRPGQKVHISVPGCGTGSTPHTAVSAAFTRDVTLHGKADTGDADPTIKQGLKPGTYPITAHCGTNHTVVGQIAVTAGDRPSGGPGQPESHTADWFLVATAIVIAAIASALLLRRRRND
jgi:hypothetical protein